MPAREWGARVREWYETELGWACAPASPGRPVELLTGLRFDVLELPAGPGFAVLRLLGPACPVVLEGGAVRLLVAAGSAEEVPGLLEWLEWGALPLDLVAIGAGGRTTAPRPPNWPGASTGSRGAAVWLRPPEPGCEWEPVLPGLPCVSALARGAATTAARRRPGPQRPPDLVRLLNTAATQCHRFRLRGEPAQRCASS